MKSLLTILLIVSQLFQGAFVSPVGMKNVVYEIYQDALAPGWSNWSWANVNFSAGAPVHTGMYSISVAMDAWEGLYLHNGGATALGASDLRFYLHGGSSSGQSMNVFLNLEVDGSNVNGPSIPVEIDNAATWLEFRLPLTTLNPDNDQITGITWQSSVNTSQPTFFVDDIEFVSLDDPAAPQINSVSISRRSILADGESYLTVQAHLSDPQGLGNLAQVQVEPFLEDSAAIPLMDDGFHNDGLAGDGIYGAALQIPPSAAQGEVFLLVSARDFQGHLTSQPLGAVVILTPAGGDIPDDLPQRLGWGSNQWSENPGADWQVNSGVPWDYVYQYITFGWETWGEHFVTRFVDQAWSKQFIPVVTVYLMLGTPVNCGENPICYASKLQNASSVNAYFETLSRAALEAAGTEPVIFVIEPDFYGYMQQLSNNSAERPAGVVANDPSSYPVALNRSGYANNLAGFGQYLVDRIHQLAPNALVAPMASMWAVNNDPQNVTTLQAIEMAQSTATFIDAMGGTQADLLTVEFSDRNAGYYEVLLDRNSWWDDQDFHLPRVNRALLWENVLSRTSDKRLLLWQVPAGNMNLNNTCDHYIDNRPAYLFDFSRDVFESGVFGVVFGGGAECTTNVNTDGGFIAAQGEIAYDPPLVPVQPEVIATNDLTVYLRWSPLPLPDLWGYSIHYQLMGTTIPGSAWMSERTSAMFNLPGEGLWEIWLTSHDAMGQESLPSDKVIVNLNSDQVKIFLPLVSYK